MRFLLALCTLFAVGNASFIAADQNRFADYECPCKNRNKKPGQPQPKPEKTIKPQEKPVQEIQKGSFN